MSSKSSIASNVSTSSGRFSPEEGLLLEQNVENVPSGSITKNLNKFSSFASLAGFKDGGEMFLQRSPQRCTGVLLQGPRKFMRLCVFGILLPVFLISVPLYVRLIMYPPQQYIMASTDQRLLSQHSSSIWCQGTTVRMNGSFNAYMMNAAPTTSKRFSTHVMTKHLTLKDDVKEYWGFFLQKGSVVTLSLCTRYDGGMLMIMKGVTNLRKCAWIGEEDSAEQDEDHMDTSNESGEPPHVYRGVNGNLTEDDLMPKKDTSFLHNEKSYIMSSAERKHELDYYVQMILRLGKSKQDILQLLRKKIYPVQNTTSKADENTTVNDTVANGTVDLIKRERRRVRTLDSLREVMLSEDIPEALTPESKLNRIKRTLDKNDDDGAFEIVNDNDIYEEVSHFRQNSSMEMPAYIKEEYMKLFHLPSGLTYERGKFNQTHNHDASNEEERSSFSSSEEALTKCSGLQGLVPLFQNRQCSSFNDTRKNRITYKVPSTGTYYFVFSSDNEVFDSEIFLNMTLQRVVFDTRNATRFCHNETNCSLALTFWSHDQAIVEVPEGDWDSDYTLDVLCKPRVSVYLGILILVPIIFLFCALQ